MAPSQLLPRTLVVLHALMALNAIGGGLYGLSGAEGVPRAWLEGTLFNSYLVPSLILLFVVGGSQGAASVMAWRHADQSRATSLWAGIIVLGWIGVQVAMIGYVSWLQPAVALAGAATLALALGLPTRRS